MSKDAIVKLPSVSEHPAYWALLARWAAVFSDGCTGVKDYYIRACHEHDYHCLEGRTLFYDPITRREADARFRHVIQMLSPLGRLSPMSWWRWAGVRLFALVRGIE